MKLPTGTPLSLEEAELFIKSRKDRESFNGLVQMHGKIAEKEYIVELLISEGEVIAMEMVGTPWDTPLKGENAMEEIKKLGGSEGDLKLISFRDEDMNKIIENNVDSLLKKRVILENFKIRIKPILTKQPSETPEGKGMLSTVKGLFSAGGGGPPLKSEFKGQFKLEFTEPEKKEFDIKSELIARIKGRRFGRLTEKLLARRKVEKPKVEQVVEGKMVETTIDKLFNLVDKRDKVKINDGLAKELGVSKERIEEWAVILEEHKLVTINYPTIGEPEITKKKK